MLDAKQVVDKYFLETRCMLIEIAATLDRVDRAAEHHQDASSFRDARVDKIRDSLALLADADSGPHRSEQILMLFTDPEK